MTSADLGHHERAALGLAAESSAVEAIGGAAAVVLGILGLAQVSPTYLAPIAAIVVGVALWFEGAAIVARYSRVVVAEARGGVATEAAPAATGLSAEFLGGAAGTILGILALLGVASVSLTSIAVIVYGASLLFGSGMQARVSTAVVGEGGTSPGQELVREAAAASSGTQLLVGVGAAVLGILALVGFAPEILILTALLTVGASLAMSGAAFTTTRMMQQRLGR